MVTITVFNEYDHHVKLLLGDGSAYLFRPRMTLWAVSMRRAFLGVPATATFIPN